MRAALRPRAVLAAALLLAAAHGAWAADSQTTRGKYLVTVAGCSDCHTPGALLGHPDMSRFLGGSDVGMAIPGMGVFVGRNLTPDVETGLGGWTIGQIVIAFTTGIRPDGRILAPVMPWQDYADLTKADALAIAAYLKSLPPVNHVVPEPFGPGEMPTTAVMTVVPGGTYAGMPKPSASPSK